ncbi:mechanosensitive ion channel family protein [Acuticoccus sediminis]|uniref:mechanosensitive ion channel family protein n=1 Tax=Acuticoccus sediminis TaxID=2184697 RepID=UPI001CFD63B0|nr:mechanosensitive ion channel family protein [Acuticoccus sediminis]
MRFMALAFAVVLFIVPAAAQENAPPAAEAAAPAGDAAPETQLPAAITNPDIPDSELKLRLVPLTKQELAEAAAAWLGIVKSKTEAVSEAMIAVAAADGSPTDVQRERVTTLTAERKALFDNYADVIRAWELKGGDPDAVAEYKAYQSAIFIDEVRTSDFKTLLNRALEWLTSADGGVELGLDIIIIVIAIAALLVVAQMVRRTAGRAIGRVPNLSKLLQAFLLVVVYWATIAIGLMVVLSALGVDISPLFAVVGGASFILAFALQDTLGNLAAGLMIMINRPFDEGDYVDIGGTAGTVQKMNIVSTTVTTPDNQIILVPNGKVWGNIITNVTGSTTRRVDFVFGISYSDSVEKAQSLLEAIVAEHPLILSEPAPVVRVNALNESSVDFIVRPWTRGEDYWTVYWDITRAVKERFDEAGISIPFPQRDIHVHQASASNSLAAE